MALFNFGSNKEDSNNPVVAPVFPQDIYQMGVLNLRDILAPSALKVTPRLINLGDKVARTFYVISYPRFLSGDWFSPLINLDKVFDISILIHPIDTSIALRQLEKKVAEVQSQISIKEDKGLVRDPVLDTAYSDIETPRDSLQ